MWFIGRIDVPATAQPSSGLAYVFMTDATEPVDDTAGPEGGENAAIIQSSEPRQSHGEVPSHITVTRRAEGPTVGPDHLLVDGGGPDAQGHLWQFAGGDPNWVQVTIHRVTAGNSSCSSTRTRFPCTWTSATAASGMPSSHRTGWRDDSSGSAADDRPSWHR
jgi:hypothetical protein